LLVALSASAKSNEDELSCCELRIKTDRS